jgi:hypothetical protein
MVTRRSPFTGKVNTLELPIDDDTFHICSMAYDAGALLQDAFPMLSAAHREYIKTGITPEEWEAVFGKE